MSARVLSQLPPLHSDAQVNTTRGIEAGRDGLSSPAHKSMIPTQEKIKSSVNSAFSKMLQRFYTVGASDSPKSKAPKQESPSWFPNTSITQALPVPVPKLGYNPETSQLTTPTRLGTRLREAWKSVLPRRESVYQSKPQLPILTSPSQCVGCFKEVPLTRLITAPCQHKYCPDCIYNMASLAMRTKTLFPVRCCGQEIPAKPVASTMSVRERKLYISRVDEHAVPAAERWYCPQTYCRRWIHPRNFAPSKPLKCPYCRALICLDCRDLAHNSRACVVDSSLDEVLRMARQKYWQRCFNCHTLVEKIEGCRHMKCVCRAEFW
jgi:hypothetical protein